MFDKYLYALGRGVRGAKHALDEKRRAADPAAGARDVTPPPVDASPQAAIAAGSHAPRTPKPLIFGARPLVMGIVNVTPDSFSDGGSFLAPATAIAHGWKMSLSNVDILDIGGESTRPGHTPVSEEDELRRVTPVVRGLAGACDTPISVDTSKARVAEAALEAGAAIVNDVWGLRRDVDMAGVVAAHDAYVVVMHNREVEDAALDIVADVLDSLRRSIDIALAAGIAREKIIVDPGFGFGKTNEQSLTLLRELARVKALGFPLLVGVSRKRMIGVATGRAVVERTAGSVAASVIAAMNGADIVRVHDVAEHLDAMKIVAAIRNQSSRETRP